MRLALYTSKLYLISFLTTLPSVNAAIQSIYHGNVIKHRNNSALYWHPTPLPYLQWQPVNKYIRCMKLYQRTMQVCSYHAAPGLSHIHFHLKGGNRPDASPSARGWKRASDSVLLWCIPSNQMGIARMPELGHITGTSNYWLDEVFRRCQRSPPGMWKGFRNLSFESRCWLITLLSNAGMHEAAFQLLQQAPNVLQNYVRRNL